MPLYDYRCGDCGHAFEASRPVKERDQAECPKCRSEKVERVFQVSNVARAGGASSGASCRPARGSSFG